MSRKIEFIDLKKQYQLYKKEIDEAVINVMSSAQFIMGSEVIKFENSLQKYTDSKFAITVSSGTDALLIALMALDIKAGDEVITSPFTFYATAEVISFLGAKPVFVDIDEDTYNIDPKKIRAKINKKTKAIMPVSLYGQVADMDEINKIAGKIPVIEDACQSFGATYKGKQSGNLSTIGAISFFPSKPLGCYGDGGAIFTNNAKLAEKMISLRIHGQTERYFHKYIGINGRFDAIQAAVLNVKMKYFASELTKRHQIGAEYTKRIDALKLGVITPKIMSDRDSVYAQYSIRVKNRESVIEKLSSMNVPTAIHYPKPLHMQAALKYLGHKRGDFPIAEKVSKEIMSLPMSPFLSQDDMIYIVESLAKAVAK